MEFSVASNYNTWTHLILETALTKMVLVLLILWQIDGQ